MQVEGELGRMEMAEHANKELIKQHDRRAGVYL